jgi:hypothetical protein
MDQQELLPMRLALVRAGIRRRAVWSMGVSRSWKSPSLPLRQKRQAATAIVIPGEMDMKASNKEPLQQRILHLLIAAEVG